MSEELQTTGGCQCGAIRYRLERPPAKVTICFCRMCQKAVGGYFAAYAETSRQDIAWTRGRPAVFASSQAAERGFCKDCGTPMTFAYRDGGALSVAAGTLDDPAALRPGVAYGVEGRMPWFEALCSLRGTRTEDDVPADELPRYRSRQHPDHET